MFILVWGPRSWSHHGHEWWGLAHFRPALLKEAEKAEESYFITFGPRDYHLSLIVIFEMVLQENFYCQIHHRWYLLIIIVGEKPTVWNIDQELIALVCEPRKLIWMQFVAKSRCNFHQSVRAIVLSTGKGLVWRRSTLTRVRSRSQEFTEKTNYPHLIMYKHFSI